MEKSYFEGVKIDLESKKFDFYCNHLLKVPKREIFETELSTLSDPIWVGDLRNEQKNQFV
jgi:hypothetical protein